MSTYDDMLDDLEFQSQPKHIGRTYTSKGTPRCFRCGKMPHELDEYVDAAHDEDDLTPEQFVKEEEGTYNPELNTFACTLCYVAIGAPSAPHGWKAPSLDWRTKK